MELRRQVLIWMTLQNSIHTLLLRYVRSRDVAAMFRPSVAVLLTEILKSGLSLMALRRYSPSLMGVLQRVRKEILCAPRETGKLLVPSLVYTLQNNLFYLAASHLNAASFMITSQLKILTTALFSRFMLHKTLTRIQWAALLILFLGVAIVQLPPDFFRLGAEVVVPKTHERAWLGLAAVSAASILSGFGCVYFEALIKGRGKDKREDDGSQLWIRNLQLSLCSTPLAAVVMEVQDGSFLYSHGHLYGFDGFVWLVVVWYGIGGLSVSLCIRWADNILKNFATSVAIVISTLASVILFGFRPSLGFFLGASLVVTSLFLYNRPVKPKAHILTVLPSPRPL